MQQRVLIEELVIEDLIGALLRRPYVMVKIKCWRFPEGCSGRKTEGL